MNKCLKIDRESELPWIQEYLDIMPTILVVLNRDGSIHLINRVGCQMLGYTAQELIHQNWFELFVPEAFMEGVQQTFASLMAGNVEPVRYYENGIRTKQGNEVIVGWHNDVLRDHQGNITGLISVGEDITLRKQAESQLLETRKNLAEVQTLAGMGAWEFIPSTREFKGSDEWWKLHYLDKDTLSVETIMSMMHPEDKASVIPRINDFLGSEGDTINIVFRHIRGDGQTIWLRLKGKTIRDENQKIIKKTGFAQDITEQRKAQEQLISFLENSPDAMILTNHLHEIMMFNRAAEQLFGYKRNELQGLSYETIISHELQIEQLEAMSPSESILSDILFHSKDNSYELTGIRKDKTRFLAEITINSFGTAENRSTVLVVRDIGPYHELEQAVLENRKKFESIFDNVAEAIIVFDLKSLQIEDMNQAALQLFQIAPLEDLNHAALGLFHVYQFPRSSSRSIMDLVAEKSEILNLQFHIQTGVYQQEPIKLIMTRNNKTNFMVSFKPSVIRIRGVIKVVAMITDLTQVMQEEANRRKKEELARQMQKQETLGLLSSGIAHDFNNVLMGILGYSELLSGMIKEGTPEFSFLEEIQKAGLRAADLVSQILNYSRSDDVDITAMDPLPIFKESTKMMMATFSKNIKIEIRHDSPVSMIRSNPTQLQQILINLCTNAAHAMEQTGGILRIELQERHCTRQTTPALPENGNYLVLKVQDTGCGIPPDVMKNIFDPFFTTKPQGKGTGLGLSIVQKIVMRQNGLLEVESEVGKGTRFTVFFRTALPETVSTVTDEFVDISGKEKILLVDDEITIIQSLKEGLSKKGYEVITVDSSVEAITLFEKSPYSFDALITDFDMPVLNGLELSRKIKRIRQDIPILMMSGLADTMDMEEVQAAGISLKLSKPISFKILFAKLRQLLDQVS
ncbi:MAG: PAS domain S-box protein [SAR324 cluster bacterium]|nr:PAS domain S-box protein [SAR324 cluster bacterium]